MVTLMNSNILFMRGNYEIWEIYKTPMQVCYY